MNLNLFESMVYGFFSGMMDILPLSARANSTMMLKILGIEAQSSLCSLFIHISLLAAVYLHNRKQLTLISRAVRLSHVPKKRRKRPLDYKSLMDFRLIRTMLIPIVLLYCLYGKTAALEHNLLIISLFMFLNGLILFVPQFLPNANKDSRSLSRVDGFLIGLGAGLSILPGISAIGASVSLGTIRGADRSYVFHMSLITIMVICIALIVFDAFAVYSIGLEVLSVSLIIKYLITAFMSFVGAMTAIQIMYYICANTGCYVFSFYCWGMALVAFILNLLA